MRKKHSLLLTVGLFLLVTFAVSMNLTARAVSSRTSSLQMNEMQERAKEMTDYARDEMQSYASLPWLLSYWEESYADMDIPIDGLSDAGWLEHHRAFAGADIKGISVSEAERLNPEEQKEFAEVCYLRIASFFDTVQRGFDIVVINCTMYRGEDEAFVFFQGIPAESGITRYFLGDLWTFHPELHPVAAKIYETGEDMLETEHVTSTTDGLEYLFVYSPVVIDGELRCLINETLLWSDTKAEIDAGSRAVARVTALWFFALFLILMVFLYRAVILPLSRVQREVRSYKEKKDGTVVRAELQKTARSKNEIGFLAADVSEMIEEIERYVEEVREQTAEKERIGAELSLATKIQADMLPNVFPAFPDRTEFDIYASMTPAREVGGDFYDFFLIDDDHLCMVIADVSGKGVPAALFMMSSKITIANQVARGKSPAQVLGDTNAAICANNRERMFVTVWLGILTISTGELVAANGGHEYPVFCMPGEKYKLMKDKHGAIIGVMAGLQYQDYTVRLTPGAKLFIYTDGVPEATNAAEELFGTERMVETLNQDVAAKPEQVLQNVRAAVDAFVGDAEQFDDLTMLCLEYKGAT